MRIAVFVASFPVVSETFILRQITGLLDLGHDVGIFAERRPDAKSPLHQEVKRYNLLERTTYLEDYLPPASGYWEMPAWPLSGETWLPGAAEPIPNEKRVMEALPVLMECVKISPHLAINSLNPEEYGYRALSLSALYRLHTLIAFRGHYDVIHAHFGPVGNTFRFVRELWNAPLVVSFHGYDFSAVPQQDGEGVYRHLFREADLFMPVSNYAQCRLQALGAPSEKLSVLRMGLNLAEYAFHPRRRSKEEPVQLLSVGRLVEKKGIEFAVRAVARARQAHPNLAYDIIGDGPLRPNLEALVEELGLKDVTLFHGSSDQAFVRHKMDNAHLFILPSVTAANGDQEGIPVSLMEAQACGLPVLSTLHSGIPELIANGRSGFLVAECDLESLADRLSYLLENTDVWPRMGQEGRAIVERDYNFETLSRRLVSLYEIAMVRHQQSLPQRQGENR